MHAGGEGVRHGADAVNARLKVQLVCDLRRAATSTHDLALAVALPSRLRSGAPPLWPRLPQPPAMLRDRNFGRPRESLPSTERQHLAARIRICRATPHGQIHHSGAASSLRQRATIVAVCAGGQCAERVTTRRRSVCMWISEACTLETWDSPWEDRACSSRKWCPNLQERSASCVRHHCGCVCVSLPTPPLWL